MDVTIEYCGMWNYKPNAAGLADELKRNFGVDTTLIEGKGGIFDVKVDGRLVYSKHETGRFPEREEVSKRIREKV